MPRAVIQIVQYVLPPAFVIELIPGAPDDMVMIRFTVCIADVNLQRKIIRHGLYVHHITELTIDVRICQVLIFKGLHLFIQTQVFLFAYIQLRFLEYDQVLFIYPVPVFHHVSCRNLAQCIGSPVFPV